jgi:hypothetical protein
MFIKSNRVSYPSKGCSVPWCVRALLLNLLSSDLALGSWCTPLVDAWSERAGRPGPPIRPLRGAPGHHGASPRVISNVLHVYMTTHFPLLKGNARLKDFQNYFRCFTTWPMSPCEQWRRTGSDLLRQVALDPDQAKSEFVKVPSERIFG